MILLRGKVGHRRLHGPYQSQLVGPSLFLGCIFAVRVELYGFRCWDLPACTFAVWFICGLLTPSTEICRIDYLPLFAGCDSMMESVDRVGMSVNEGGLGLSFVVCKS